MRLALVTRQPLSEIREHWEPEDIATALLHLDETADAIKDAQRG